MGKEHFFESFPVASIYAINEMIDGKAETGWTVATKNQASYAVRVENRFLQALGEYHKHS